MEKPLKTGEGSASSPVPAFDAAAEARRLLRSVRAGALATTDENGRPLATLVNVATDCDGAPILLVSALSAHTANMRHRPGVSLLLADQGKGDPLAHPRLSVQGSVRAVPREGEEGRRLRGRFLARHPKSALYADFPDFTFLRLEPAAFHLNGGFARAADPSAADILLPGVMALALADLEADALAHMNEDHADAVRLYATVLCGEADGPWRATGLDPDGIDLSAGDRTARLAFPAPVTDAGGLRRVLADLAAKARA